MTPQQARARALLDDGVHVMDAARRIGVSHTTIARWRRNGWEPRERARAETPRGAWWADVLRDLRRQRGLSMEEAAARAGVAVDAWGRWERGTNAPSLALFQAALQVLGHELEVVPCE